MGNYLSDYRISIGLFNNAKISRSAFSFVLRPGTLLCLALTFLLLILCGDVEMNPGPDIPLKLKLLSICHINIRGISDTKISAIKTSLCEKFEIITLSETFLSPHSSTDLSLPGYHAIIRRDRPTFGGGVAMYVKETIAYKRLYDFDCRYLENMWIEINTREGKLLVCNIYRPPSNVEFWDHFESNIELVGCL